MQHYFITLLLLITAALSSSNVLPMLTDSQHQPNSLGIDSQQYDNILSNKLKFRNIINNIFYKSTDNTDNDVPQRKTSLYFTTNRGIEKEINSISNKHGNYDGEGFRKEQWHNYPRQLDRLHDYVLGNWKDNLKINPDPDEFYHPDEALDPSERFGEEAATNSFHLDSRDITQYEVADDSKPLFIFKIHSPQDENRFQAMDDLKKYEMPLEDELKEIADEEKDLDHPLEDINIAIKVKREGSSVLQSSSGNKKKRIFSLWSRLQSMSPKGHELPHRRHIHAFYSLPDAEGSGTLTAEPRAFIRPPGSPLRWG